VVREPGRRVEPDRDRVEVRGRPLPGRSALRYFLIHKPVGMITTLSDPEGRPTVRALLPPGPRLFPVGRLDADTSGLLLVTNDGELAHKLMHPRYEVEKRYKVLVDRVPDSRQLARLRAGVEIEPGVRTGAADVRLARAHAERPTLDVRIHEGRYRQVRRMCEAVGLAVKSLHRYGYGPLQIGLLPKGATRALSEAEVRRLKAVAARPGGVRPRATIEPERSRQGERGRARTPRSRPPRTPRSRPPRTPRSRPPRAPRSRPPRGPSPRPPRAQQPRATARRDQPRGRPARGSTMGQTPKRAGRRPSQRRRDRPHGPRPSRPDRRR
jgi:pseudouridine synthase